jgi:hypothetical protein
MSDQSLWALMQRVEKMRHRAELLDGAASQWTIEARLLAADIALQWRQLAEEGLAAAEGGESDAATSLCWSQLWVSDPDDPDAEPAGLGVGPLTDRSPKRRT